MPTALQLTREQWARYKEHNLQRSKQRAPSTEEERERQRLMKRLRRVAKALKEEFDVKRVVVFGSLAHAAWYMPDSDIDLAVDGLANSDYFKAWRLAEEILEDRPIDFIDMQAAGNSLRKAIERDGIDL